MHNRSIFELDGHSLVVQFHQKPENNRVVLIVYGSKHSTARKKEVWLSFWTRCVMTFSL